MFILSLCDVPEVLEVLQIVEVVIMAFRIAAPIILIVSGMITLMNTIKSGNEDLLAKSKKILINKIIAAVLIFFVPLLVKLIIMLAGGDTDYKNCININESTINSAYSSNANRYMDSAQSNLSRSDYDRAQSSINKITDEDLKKKYQDRLDEIGKLLDESGNSNGNGSSGGYNNTTTTRYSGGGNYGNNGNNTTTRNSSGGAGNENGSGGNGGVGQKTTSPSSTMAGTYYLGDSRTNGLASALGANESVIAKDGGNYNDFVTHSATLKSKLNNSTGNYNVVLNYGVNDLGNVNKYCEGYKSLANTIGSNHKVYVVSVNPMNDNTKWNATNASINNFNSSMKSCISSVSNITYCDVNSTASNAKWVSDYLSSDGLHYNSNGYKYIHSKILSCIG
mgnify:CR=1 FL=1